MTLDDVCNPVSSHIKILSLRLWERGVGWQSAIGTPKLAQCNLMGAVVWISAFSAAFVNWQGGRQLPPLSQPFTRGTEAAEWASTLYFGLSRSDTIRRGDRVSTFQCTNTHACRGTPTVHSVSHVYVPTIQGQMMTVKPTSTFTSKKLVKRQGQYIKHW